MRDHDLTKFKQGNEIVQSGHDLTKLVEQIITTWPQYN